MECRVNKACSKMYPNKSKKKNKRLLQRVGQHFVSCANICSIHGFIHIVRKNISLYERLLWFLLVTSATAWCIELALQAWNRYQTRPTVITLERDHWKWNTTFPTVTLCLNDIDYDKADELTTSLEIPVDAATEFKEFLKALATADFSVFEDMGSYTNISLYQDVEKYLDWVLRTSATLDYPVEIGQSFGELHEFQTILTEVGLCFAYNSRIAIYSTPEYRAQRTNKLINSNNTVLKINPSIPSPTLSIRGLSAGYKIFFHGSNEIPDLSTKGRSVAQATFTSFGLSIESVWTPPEVEELKISQRKCRFTKESNIKNSPVYSYNLCRAECRKNLCLRLCNCVPYYYTHLENEPICNIAGMNCLHKNKVLIMSLSDETGKSVCSCIQNCDTDSVTITKMEVTDWFLGTNVQWKVAQYPTIRYKRSLIYSQTNLLVQIGGVAALFLGCSVLSLVELLYVFTLRFYWGVIKGRIV